jgi:hypothetical protein
VVRKCDILRACCPRLCRPSYSHRSQEVDVSKVRGPGDSRILEKQSLGDVWEV